MSSPQDLLREYAQLNRRRKSDGVSPLEYLRWQDLRGKLEKAFPGRPAPGGGGVARVAIDYATETELSEAVMRNVKPLGLFVHTPFAPAPGERFELRVRVAETRARYDAQVTVVSNNLGPGFSTADMGMGLRIADKSTLYAFLRKEPRPA